MDLAIIVIRQLGIMLILILAGIICSKTNIVDKATTKKLSDLLLCVVNPMTILTAYQQPFSTEVFHGILWTLLLSAISFGLSIALSFVLIRTGNDSDKAVERCSMIYKNCGFMGIPLISSIFGSEGVVYLTAYLTMFNILVWSHGLMVMKGEKSLRSLAQAFRSPAVIATLLGFALYVLKIQLPSIPLTALDYLGSMNTPLAMIIAGATIAVSKISPALKNKRFYYACALNLFAVPLITILATKFIPAPEIAYTTTVIASACPVATTCTLFAIKFDRNSEYASQLFSFTTLLCAVTIPVIALIC